MNQHAESIVIECLLRGGHGGDCNGGSTTTGSIADRSLSSSSSISSSSSTYRAPWHEDQEDSSTIIGVLVFSALLVILLWATCIYCGCCKFGNMQIRETPNTMDEKQQEDTMKTTAIAIGDTNEDSKIDATTPTDTDTSTDPPSPSEKTFMNATHSEMKLKIQAKFMPSIPEGN